MQKDNIKIGIVGLGMMGCSLAHSLKQISTITSIIGCDNNDVHSNEALRLGIINKIMPLEEIIHNVDIVFLIIPSRAILKIFPLLELIDKDTTIVDFSSTKEVIVKNIPSCIKENFVPSHPMCGNEKSGPNGLEEDLYKNKTIIICNEKNSNNPHLQLAKKIFSLLDMNIIYMTPQTHDLHIGYISHLPHIVSFSLANSVLNQEDPSSIVNLRGGGFESMSRIAKSSASLWRDIFEANCDNLSIALDEYESELKIFKEYLKQKDWDSVEKWIRKSNKLQDIL